MDKEQSALDQPWTDLEALVDFIDDLRLDGYNIGVKEYLDVHQVLLAAVARGATLSDPDQVSRLISPILCTSPDEQAEFSARFQTWARRAQVQTDHQAGKGQQPSLEKELREITWKDRMRWLPALLIFLVLTTVTGALLVARFGLPIRLRGNAEPPAPALSTPAPAAGVGPSATAAPLATPTLNALPTPQPLSIQQRLGVRPDLAQVVRVPAFWLAAGLALLIVAAGMFILRRWWYRYRAQLFLDRRKSDEPPDITRIRLASSAAGLFETAEMREITRYFRRRQRTPSKQLDIDRTLGKTVQQAGWLTPVYGGRQQAPEYLVLVSRSSYPDHLAHLVEEQLNFLRSGNVYLTLYYFDGTPQLCLPPSARLRPVTLAELATRASNQRLLIFGEAQAVLDPVTGEPAAWTRWLTAWPVRGLFTPAPPSEWGAAEQQAARALGVWTALPEGLDLFVRTVYGEAGTPYVTDRRRASRMPMDLRTRPIRWLQPDPPADDQVQRVLAGVRGYLGEWGFTWLCACAIYPEVNWNLTLFLGALLDKVQDVRSPAFQRTLLDLTRLPWFQYGMMPDWLRKVLIAGLQRPEEEQVRIALQGLLLTALDNPAGGFSLEIAQTYHTAVRKLVGPLLRLLSKRAGPDNPFADPVFLVFMGGHTRTQLAFRLPTMLRAAFARPKGGGVSSPPLAGRLSGTKTEARTGSGAGSGQRLPSGAAPGSSALGLREWLTSRTTLILLVLTAFALVVAYFTYPTLERALVPVHMRGALNIAVADFSVSDPTLAADTPDVGQQIGRTIFEHLADLQTGETDAPKDLLIWHDSLKDSEKRIAFGAMQGTTASERLRSAAALADRIGAQIVVYGTVAGAANNATQFAPEIYVRSELTDAEFNAALAALAQPIVLPAASGTANQAAQIALLRWSEALFWLLTGQVASLSGSADKAQQAFGRMQTAQVSGVAGDGAWEMVGREALRRKDYAGAIAAFGNSLATNPLNPYAKVQLARTYVERATAVAADLAGLPPAAAQCRAPTATAATPGDISGATADIQQAQQRLAEAANAAQDSEPVSGYRAAVQLTQAQAQLAAGWLTALQGDGQSALQQLAQAAATVDAATAQGGDLPARLQLEAQFTVGRISALRGQLEAEAAAAAQDATEQTRLATSSQANLQHARDAYQRCSNLSSSVSDPIAVRDLVQCGCQAYAGQIQEAVVANPQVPTILPTATPALASAVVPTSGTGTPGAPTAAAAVSATPTALPPNAPPVVLQPTAAPTLASASEPASGAGKPVLPTPTPVVLVTPTAAPVSTSGALDQSGNAGKPVFPTPTAVVLATPTAAPPNQAAPAGEPSGGAATPGAPTPTPATFGSPTPLSQSGAAATATPASAVSTPIVTIVETGPGTMSDNLPGLLTFRVTAFDPTAGKADGEGIDRVEMSVFAVDGTQVLTRNEASARYCAFAGGARQCNTWVFADNKNAWPDGTPFTPGSYTLRAQAFTPDGRSGSAEMVVTINAPVDPTPTSAANIPAVASSCADTIAQLDSALKASNDCGSVELGSVCIVGGHVTLDLASGTVMYGCCTQPTELPPVNGPVLV